MNEKLPLLSLLCLLLLPGFLLGQQRHFGRRHCGTMEHMQGIVKSNPNVKFRMREIERSTQRNAKSAFTGVPGTIRVPVVVHVVYNNSEQNISDAQIRSQIKVLNEDFQRMNGDAISTPQAFRPRAANSRISFQLAQIDPSGNPTTGITRHRTTQRSFYASNNGVKYSAMGGVDGWEPEHYLNIWICNLGMGMLGYAQFPGGPRETDGVVIGYKFFGTMGTVSAPFDLGRTCTHEVGHYFNLRHIWGDGDCSLDDFVEDTPVADEPHHGCVSSDSDCGHPVMTSNFMDYTDDACMNMFTKGQANRMRTLFAPSGYRHGLLGSPALQSQSPIVSAEPPRSLEAMEVTNSTARLTWNPVNGAEKYHARFRPMREGKNWATKSFTRTYVQATRLRACTEYEFQLESVVDGVRSGYTPSAVFRTRGCAEENAPIAQPANLDYSPDNLYASSLYGTEATLNWDRVPGATRYYLQYKAAGSKRVYSKLLSKTSAKISGLESGKRYLWRVRAHFGEQKGKFSFVANFVPSDYSATRMVAKSSQVDYLRTWPKTVQSKVEIQFDYADGSAITPSILDRNGKEVQAFRSVQLPKGRPIQLNLGHLPNGAYQLCLTDADGFTHHTPINVRH
ncbi:MAG: M43 family zinc metalloprotease [Bacteroidota bacterium]